MRSVGDVGGKFPTELALEAAERDVLGDRTPCARAGVVPRRPEEVVLRTEGVLVDVAVLDDEPGDSAGMGHCQLQTELGAVIVEPDDVAVELHRVDERLQEARVRGEGVLEAVDGRRCTVAEPGQVRSEEAPAVAEENHQVAVDV